MTFSADTLVVVYKSRAREPDREKKKLRVRSVSPHTKGTVSSCLVICDVDATFIVGARRQPGRRGRGWEEGGLWVSR